MRSILHNRIQRNSLENRFPAPLSLSLSHTISLFARNFTLWKLERNFRDTANIVVTFNGLSSTLNPSGLRTFTVRREVARKMAKECFRTMIATILFSWSVKVEKNFTRLGKVRRFDDCCCLERLNIDDLWRRRAVFERGTLRQCFYYCFVRVVCLIITDIYCYNEKKSSIQHIDVFFIFNRR